MGTMHIMQYRVNVLSVCQGSVLYNITCIAAQPSSRAVRETVVYVER
jgi:hypothetical protein